MSTFYRLMVVLMVLTTPSLPSWGQEEASPAADPLPAPVRLSSQAQRSSYPLNTQHQMQMLARQLEDKKAVQWVNSNEDNFLAIWQPDRSGDAKGAVLIIHAEGEHPAWPQTTKPLHETLPDYGWATMAIHLPDPSLPPSPARTLEAKAIVIAKPDDQSDANEQTTAKKDKPEEPSTPTPSTTPPTNSAPQETTVADVEPEVEQRMVSALKFLHDKGQFNIVVMGSGVGAIRSHTFIKSITPIITDEDLKDKLEKPIRASIIFNARNHLSTADEEYEDWFFDPEIPVLDIYTKNDIRNIKEARVRKILGKQKKAITHSQLKIADINYEKSWGENQLSRRIRSFLDAYLQGIEVKRKNAN